MARNYSNISPVNTTKEAVDGSETVITVDLDPVVTAPFVYALSPDDAKTTLELVLVTGVAANASDWDLTVTRGQFGTSAKTHDNGAECYHVGVAEDLSTNVTLAGTGTYLSLAGQQITVDPITESDISDLGAYITDVPYGSTGVLTGGVLSTGAGAAEFSISDGTGIITSAAGVVTSVSWSGKTNITPANIATNLLTWVAIDSGGNVVEQITPFTASQGRSLILLGVVVHVDNATVDNVNNEQIVAYQPLNTAYDVAGALGFINISGNVFSANGANLQINKSVGVIFKIGSNYNVDTTNPHNKTLAQLTGATFQYRFSDGSNGATGTAIDPDNVDDKAGGLTAVGNNQFSVQRIYSFVSNNVKIQRGAETFATLSAAIEGIASEAYVTEPSIAANGLLRGWLVVKKGATDLSNTSEAQFIPAPKFGEGQAGGSSTPAGDSADLILSIKKATAGTLSVGDVVHATGISGTDILCELADADAAGGMPALGIVRETATDSATGRLVFSGVLRGLDTSTYSVGDPLYCSTTAGARTTAKPAARRSAVQKVALVLSVDATAGVVQVVGAGRANDIPNFTAVDAYWYGDVTGASVEGTITSFGRSLVDDANQAAAQATLGVVIGANVQAYAAQLDTWAGITPSANAQSLVSAATYAAMRTLLDLEADTDFYSISAANAAFEPIDGTILKDADIGTTVQAQNAKLQAVADLANTSGVLTNDGAGNFSYEATGGGGSTEDVAQTAHGLTAGNVIRSSGTANQYAKAQSDSAVNADAVGIVTVVDDANNFTYAFAGVVTVGVPVAAAGTAVFLDPSVSGGLTTTQPSTLGQIEKPLGVIIESGAKMLWLNYRGTEVEPVSSFMTDLVDDTTPQLGGELDLNSKNINIGAIPPTNLTTTGSIMPATAGETLAFGDLVYWKSVGKVWKTDASAEATSGPVMLGIIRATEAADDPTDILLSGYARNDTWAWTVGGAIYVSETAGALTQTVPTASLSVVRCVGYALSADVIIFNPDSFYVVVA